MKTPRFVLTGIAVSVASLLSISTASAQMEFEAAPISYDTAPVNDRITKLQAKIDAGEVEVKAQRNHGYLDAILQLLDVPQSSQVLVFSKTSLQLRRITPDRPRAVYFNDDTYVGYCQQGEVLEIATQDPQQGTIFLHTRSGEARRRQPEAEVPAGPGTMSDLSRLVADSRSAGGCWSGRSTRMAADIRCSGQERSRPTTRVHSQSAGAVGTSRGNTVSMRHMGNVQAHRKSPENIDREAGANITDLGKIVSVGPLPDPA